MTAAITHPVQRDPDRPRRPTPRRRDGAGWDLSSGCRVSIGHNRDLIGTPLEWTVTVATSGEDQRRGITVRTVTPEQVEAFARHLLDLVAEHRG